MNSSLLKKIEHRDDTNSTQGVKLIEDSINSYLRAPGFEDFRW